MQKASVNTSIEEYVISQVKALRERKKLSQSEFGFKIGLSASFIGDVENPTRRAKYNLNHLNKIVAVFGGSFQDFFPKEALK